jgi:hypothetical protein
VKTCTDAHSISTADGSRFRGQHDAVVVAGQYVVDL